VIRLCVSAITKVKANPSGTATKEAAMEQKSHADVNDLALLALLASTELEELNARGTAECFYVGRLFDHLSAEIPELTPDGVKRLAPSTMRVYERAVHDATNRQANDLTSLSKMLAGFLKDLKAASQSTARRQVDSDELQRLLAFLNSLHDQLITQKQRAINKRVASRHRI
jgi:hypothetical protein